VKQQEKTKGDLSTSASSESNTTMTSYSVATSTILGSAMSKEIEIMLSTKDIYYMITKTTVANINNLHNRNADHKLILKAVCAYL